MAFNASSTSGASDGSAGGGHLYFNSCSTPCSIISTDSDIRFTRKFSNHYKCGCCLLASFLLVFLATCVFFYIAYNYLKISSGGEKTFNGMFTVIGGDAFNLSLANASSSLFKSKSAFYEKELSRLIQKSTRYKFFYLGAKVEAFDGEEGGNLTVYFTLKFNSALKGASLEKIRRAIVGWKIDDTTIIESSLVLTESEDSNGLRQMQMPKPAPTPNVVNDGPRPAVATENCSAVRLQLCQNVVPYNFTRYPNSIGHKTEEDVLNDIIAFRELIDSECYEKSAEVICHLLQPPCATVSDVHLSREMCEDFTRQCGHRFSTQLTELSICDDFPISESPSIAKPEPTSCSEELNSVGLSNRICDGMVDCADSSDEAECAYCPSASTNTSVVRCVGEKKCVPSDDICNGFSDCADGSDEQNCLSVIPETITLRKNEITAVENNYDRGYATYCQNGVQYKICLADSARNNNAEHAEQISHRLATTICTNIGYEMAAEYQLREGQDQVTDSKFVDAVNSPTAATDAPSFAFVPSSCSNRKIFYVVCKSAECGKQRAIERSGIDGYSEIANAGDWPWMVALFKDGIHICDATLISSEWLITSISCFQGQNQAKWIAKFGITRLYSDAHFMRERLVIGMVTSPVEGSTIVLLKLNQTVSFSRYIWPVCLPNVSTHFTQVQFCNTLGWSKIHKSLKRIEVKETSMEKCANVSIPTVNNLCAESTYEDYDCAQEEFAGSSMICSVKGKWTLFGISNWRNGCLMTGTQRPRLYDKVNSNLGWILKTVAAS